MTLATEDTKFLHQGLDWVPESNCFEMDILESEILFFPRNHEEIKHRAWESVCSSCPVKQQCEQWGEIINGEGVFGGEFRGTVEPTRSIQEVGSTVAGNQPGWKLLEKGKCKHGHEVLSSTDLHIRTRNRDGSLTQEAQCYRCWKRVRNSTPSFRRKSGPRSERKH